MWENSAKPDVYEGLDCPQSHGWLKKDDGYVIDWEDKKVEKQIRTTLKFLEKGCACKTVCKTK